MSLVNTAAIGRLLTPGIMDVYGQYKAYNDQWNEIYSTHPSSRAYEFDLEMKYTGLASIKEEGQPGSVDSMGERSVTNYIHRMVQVTFVITREALADNQYQDKFPAAVQSQRNSLRTTKNTLAANILNNAFNNAFPIGDGQPVCSTAHPIDGTVASNRPAVGAAFSENAIEQAIIQIQRFPMVSGMLSQTMVEKLIVPAERQFDADRLLNSTFRINTANNDISAIYNGSYIPKGVKVNQFLTNPRAWFVLTDAESGFKHYQREDVQVQTYADPDTYNLKFSAFERYSFGLSNWRALYGSPGA